MRKRQTLLPCSRRMESNSDLEALGLLGESVALSLGSNAIAVHFLPASDVRWQQLMNASDDALPFHHPSWMRTLSACYGYRAFILALTDGHERLHAGLPVMEVTNPLAIDVNSSGVKVGRRKWVALPFTDYCPPLVPHGGDLADVVDAFDAARRDKNISRFEVRADLDVPGSFKTVVAVRHTLELHPDPEVVYRTFDRSQTQRNIRRAKREGVVALRRGETIDDLAHTYYDLHLETRRRQGIPTQPRRFFEHLWREMLEPGNGFLLLASVDGVPIAGGVFLTWKDSVVYKFGASSSRFWSLRPNNLLFWEAIRWSCERGFRIFDFGRSDLANHGLRNFKNNWGAHETPLKYSVISDSAPKHIRPTLPRPVSAAIRGSPMWVSRLLGELLYRVAA